MIIALTGPHGAGKTWMSEYLFKKYDFEVIGLSDFLRKELSEKGIKENVREMAKIANELRARYGAGYLAKKALEDMKEHRIKKAVVDAVRNVSEIEELKNSGEKVHVIKVDGPLEMRWERYNSYRSEEDYLSLEEFILLENKEMEGNKYSQQLKACMELADGTVFNDGDLIKLKSQVEEEIYQFIEEF